MTKLKNETRKPAASNKCSRRENRNRLEKATTEYFESLTPPEFAEECSMAKSFRRAANKIDVHGELSSLTRNKLSK